MQVEIHAAIVGGVIAGLVVFVGLWVELRVSRAREERSRQKSLLSSILGEYLFAITLNVQASTDGDRGSFVETGSRILAAHGQILVFGTSEMATALEKFEESGKNMGTREGQDTLLGLLGAMRQEVFPSAPPLDTELAKRLMFERPA